MAFTVDTVQLRYKVTGDYDDKQIGEIRADMKDLEKTAGATRRAIDKSSEAYRRLGDEIAEATRQKKELDKKRTRTADEEKELAALTKRVGELNRRREEQRNKMAALSDEYRKQTTDLQGLQAKLNKHVETIGLENTNLKELTRRQREYRAILNSTKPNTAEFQEYAEKLREVNEQIRQTKAAMEGTQDSLEKFDGKGGFLKNLLGAKLDFGQLKTFLSANLITGAVTAGLELVGEYAGRALDRVKELVVGSIDAAREAEGISRAFKALEQPGLLGQLRKATHGTVADLELMKAAVQANDFRLPLDQLGKYLEFAQLKAQQTGQSVDFLTTSIVTGLGRKSQLILDNLGLSSAEIKEEMEKTGDMATAVGAIIDRQLSEAGEHFVTAAEREQKATTDVTNAQLTLGEKMRETFGIGSTSFAEMQAKAEVFVLNGLTKLVVYLQDLYNRLASVRVAVELVKTSFDTVFKVCEVGFKWLIDVIKGVARVFSGLAGVVESVFTFNPDNIKAATERLFKDIGRTIGEFVADGKDVGTRWGKNVNDSIRAVMGRAEIPAPKVAPPKLPRVAGTATTDTGGSTGGKGTGGSTTVTGDPAAELYRKELAKREQAYREYGNSLRQMLLHQLLTEEEYQQESREAELKFLGDKALLQQKYGQDVTETQRQYLDKMLAEAKRRADEEAKLKKQQQDQERRDLERNRLSREGNNEYLQKVEWQQKSFDEMRRLNDDYYRQGLISYEQYQDNLTNIARQQEDQRKAVGQAAMDATQQLLQSSGQLFSALQSRETAEVDAKYKRMIAAAKKQGKDTTKLEEQQEAEKAAIQKKYADRNFKIQVLQIIANTAQGISKTISELGMPWAIPFVAMAAAAGAMQLASAKAAADQAAGLYEGGYSDDYQEGYTKKGNPRERAGVIPVHKNEFVANHRAVANPEVRPVLDVIDAHQRRGDIQILNATRLLDEAYGRYRGGYTAPPSVPGQGTPASAGTADTQQLTSLLERIEQNTARSLTVRRLRDEISHEERLERNARR